MAPKPIPLAYAGKKLVAGPEGYSRKKELQVKSWLTNVPPANEAGAPAIKPEVRVSKTVCNGYDVRDDGTAYAALTVPLGDSIDISDNVHIPCNTRTAHPFSLCAAFHTSERVI